MVIAAGALLLAYVYSGTGKKEEPGYDVRATFKRTDGLSYGAQVRLSGIVVGKVAGYKLDDSYRAIVTLRLKPGVELPKDSSALIHTDGLLGAKYIELQPGGDAENLKAGNAITYTQDSVDLVDLLEKIVGMAKARRAEFAKSLAPPAAPEPEVLPSLPSTGPTLLQGRSP
ncbi:ABC-type transport system involved in resistance to organic solvents, periplasmic component [Rhodospirillaceae bacterium LM-1]|nr:ABC-type transport system involved in resistance to organic solvents, periplasmic component [Rhodospirillaceae bacterium LM-1]